MSGAQSRKLMPGLKRIIGKLLKNAFVIVFISIVILSGNAYSWEDGDSQY